MLFSRYRDAEALRQVEAEKPAEPLVQIAAIAPRSTLQGTEVAATEKLADGVEQAFDYRGDVTVTLRTSEDSRATSSIATGSSKIRILNRRARR